MPERQLLSALAIAGALFAFAGRVSASDEPVVAPRPWHVDDERLRDVLKRWEAASRDLSTYQARIKRLVQDITWNIEKQANGRFFYASPGKWRVDIEPIRIGENTVSENKNPRSGKPYQLKPDAQETWIDDGRFVTRIEDARRKGTCCVKEPGGQDFITPIFLCTFVSSKLEHYDITFVKRNEQTGDVDLQVVPRKKPEWFQLRLSEHIVRIDGKTSLAKAFKFSAPPGNLETIYMLEDERLNQEFVDASGAAFNPFEPNLKGMEVHVYPATPRPEVPPVAYTGKVPNVVGTRFDDAREQLRQAGFEVQFKRGQDATNEKLEGFIAEQKPPADSELEAGEVVTLVFFDKVPRTRVPRK